MPPRTPSAVRVAAPPSTRRRSATIGILAAWVAFVAVTRAWAWRLIEERGRDALRLSQPPFVGFRGTELGPQTLLPLGIGGLAAWHAPRLAREWTWRRVLWGSMGLAIAWSVSLALVRGWWGITNPLVLRGDEYLLDVPLVGNPLDFLRTFTDQIDRYVVHVRSHPPGFLLLLWTLDRLGLGGTGPAAVVCIVGGASAAPAVLIGVRDVAGEQIARRAAPFVAMAPAAVWIATSADAFYAGVAAWAVAAVVLATNRAGRRSDLLALAGGIGFGIALLLAYGITLLVIVPVAVAVWRRRFRPLLIAAAGGLLVLGVLFGLGFNWIDGLLMTRTQYRESVARTRPLGFFAFSNLSALSIALGPAVLVGLFRLRDRNLWVLVGSTLAVVLIADVSGFSKGEVERIWLPFTVWLLPVGAAVVSERRDAPAQAWLAAQVAVGLAVETFVRTRW